MKKKIPPSVTFIIPTLNSEDTLHLCLQSIADLDYPKSQISAIVVDGGSRDKTRAIANSFAFCRVKTVAGGGPEVATAMGYNMATSTYCVNFPADNVIRNAQWLRRMIAPLEEDKTIIASEPWRYAYVKNDTLLNRYFALFGVNDPLAYYLKKRDRTTHFEQSLAFAPTAQLRVGYWYVDFTKENLPTVGANGFVVRTKIIQQVTKDPSRFSHIDSCVDLLNLKYCRYAFVKTDIWHKTGESMSGYFARRMRYAQTLYFEKQQMRRYHLFDQGRDKGALVSYIIFSLTLVEPLLQATRGALRVPDIAWFLHPYICLRLTLQYAYITTTHILRNQHKNKL